MRRFFCGLGIVTTFIIAAGAIGLFVLGRNGSALDAESKAYVEDSIITIATHWDADALLMRASPRLRGMMSHEELRALFDAASEALGPLLEYRGAKGQAVMSMMNSTTQVSANYVAKSTFQKGDAYFQIAIIKNGPTWMIEGFHIGSPTLMKRLVGSRS